MRITAAFDEVTPLFSRLGASAAEALLDLCQSEEPHDEWVERACRALSDFDGDTLHPHLAELIRLIPIEGYHVCQAVAKIGHNAADAVPALLAAESSQHISTTSFASTTAAIGPAAEPTLDRLVAIMSWNENGGGHAAVLALVAIGQHTLDAALNGLNEVDPDYIGQVPGAIEGIEEYGEAAVPRLTKVLDEAPSRRRTAAVLALAKFVPGVALPHLLEGLQSESSQSIQQLFLNRIAEMGPAAATAAPILRAMLRKESLSYYGESVVRTLAAVTGNAGIPDLVAQLDDPDPNFRRRTLRVLANLAASHSEARAALIRALSDPERVVRREVIELLGQIVRRGEGDVVEPLRPCLADPDAEIRAGAANVLGRLKAAASPAVPELLVAMRDPEDAVRIAATATVDGMQHEEPEMLGALLEALNDTNEQVRRHAAHGLQDWGHLYPEYTAAVFARVNDPDPDIARGATQLMGKATEATPELIAHLREQLRTSSDEDMRVSAATGLARFQVSDPEVLADVFTLLDATGRDEFIEPLVKMGPAAYPALNERLLTRSDLRYAMLCALDRVDSDIDTSAVLPGSLASLNDENEDVRARAVEVIGSMGQKAASVLPQLRAMLDDPDQFVRSAAAVSLAKVAVTPAEVLPDVVRILSDVESFARKRAVDALVLLEIEPELKLPHILTALQDDDKDVLQEAAKAAGQLGPIAAEAVPLLLPLLKHEDEWVRMPAADSLGNVGGSPEVVDALVAALADPGKWVRQTAAVSLGNLGLAAEAAIPELTRLSTEDYDSDVRCAAAESLVKLGATEAAGGSVAGLVEMLSSSDGDQRVNAAKSLGALGTVAEAAIPELAKALRDPKWGDLSAETKKRYTVMGMLLIPLESIEAIGAIDQRINVTVALRQIGPPEVVIPILAEAVCDANLLVANSAADELRQLLPESGSSNSRADDAP